MTQEKLLGLQNNNKELSIYFLKYLLLFIFCISASYLNSQSLKGIWKGSFEIQQESGSKVLTNKYNFEIQLNQINVKNLTGVTYSYKTKEYFGKATFRGEFNISKNTVTINESDISEVENSIKSDICKMICMLKYSKRGEQEILSGVFTSFNQKNSKFCYKGKVELQKVATTTFPKEPFLNDIIKPKKVISSKNEILIPTSSKTDNYIAPEKEIPQLANENKNLTNNLKTLPEYQLPKEYISRQTNLVHYLRLNEKNVNISFYDNGIVDKDTISVFINGKLLINKKMIDYVPISIQLYLNKENPIIEIIAVAENLGDYHPNTALMVLTFLNKRFEIPISTDFKNNTKVIIEFDETKEVLIKRY